MSTRVVNDRYLYLEPEFRQLNHWATTYWTLLNIFVHAEKMQVSPVYSIVRHFTEEKINTT